MAKGRSFTNQFQAKVALKAPRGNKTGQEIAVKSLVAQAKLSAERRLSQVRNAASQAPTVHLSTP